MCACMEHTCLDCGWWTMDNHARGPLWCPKCGSDNIHHYFDEPEWEHDADYRHYDHNRESDDEEEG